MHATFIPANTFPTPSSSWIAMIKILVVGLLSPQSLIADDDTLAIYRFDAE